MSFDKKPSEKQLVYAIKANLTNELAEELASDLKKETDNPACKFEAIIFDLQGNNVENKSFKALAKIGLDLRKGNRQVYLLTDNRSIHAQIKQDGLDKVLRPILQMIDITASTVSKKTVPKLDVSFINPFIEGTLHVLKIQCHTEATTAKPVTKSSGQYDVTMDIAGIIGLTSKSFHGSIAICFPAPVFLSIMSKMLSEEYTEITDELKDGAAELMNMIFGYAKKILNENGHTIEKALPSVIRGPGIKLDHAGTQDSLILPFTIEKGGFYMEIGLDQI